MSLSVQDFLTAFADKELRKVVLTTWKGEGEGVVYLRGLPHYDIQRLRSMSQKVTRKKAVSVLAGGDPVEEYEEGLDICEDFLVMNTLCNESGKLLFKSSDKEFYKRFKQSLPSAVINEILYHVEDMNELYGGFPGKDKLQEELKKK